MSITSRRLLRTCLFFAAALTLAVAAGCAHQPRPEAFEPPGFWAGLLHGFLSFFSFIGSLFTEVRIYNFPNSGGWYDFGFLLGASGFLGGGGVSSSR